MNYSLLANAEPPLRALAEPCAPGNQGHGQTASLCLPELGNLIKLRDALLVLKGPLANCPGLRSLIEHRLLGNDVHARILGKRSDPPSTRAP